MQYEEMSYQQLADEVVRLQAEKSELTKKSAQLTKAIDEITIKVIPDKLAEDGFRSVNLKGGGSIKLTSQAWCSTREGMRPKLYEWLCDHEFHELIVETVNASTLKAFIKEQMELGNDVPPDEIVNYQPYSRASITGVK